ncbi:aminodeoxychorismate synthase component I [Sunxiuqinia dokdonensis]|uniref:Para-aminobenzoate synthase n=1 Tax=Sunxiuqinia dokdonensis TaxID=1409788 RepID=A0A0L8V2T4_9BACT|nr:aminodeoxychorismate synthase component I [Sunxiuqinia dokdonensis]KOH42741.1 para-aminobenzoate synthase [Sunxiuqinia dokdonensis]
MQTNKEQTILKMNELGKAKKPFVFLIDFDFQKARVWEWEESRQHLLWQTPKHSNFEPVQKTTGPISWKVCPVSYARYQKAFALVQHHLHNGDSYLLNLTMPSRIETSLSLAEIFQASHSPYKLLLKNEFVCFSPEIFIRIENQEISSFPMKGTIDARLENAAFILKNDKKELAEHNTIVDLIRNDLSMVADQVQVKKYRYLDHIKSNRSELLQMSSQITGKLTPDYHQNLGSIVATLLPAGSISGAPKKKTVAIIKEAEKYDRGYYTGIFGVFDGENLDSCVLIRYLEQHNEQLTFKSGGGITFQSNCQQEYEELVNKVYVPLA